MNSIYIEAILFVAVFTSMSIASIIISKRHAKNYVPEEEEKEERQETSIDATQQRIEELLKLTHNGILSHKEFQILKKAKLHPPVSTS